MAQVDILIFAPHPDDESIACAGTMLAAQASGQRVRVVFFTNGEGYSHAAAMQAQKPLEALTAQDYLQLGRIRQNEALTALACLGLPAEVAIFLAYPDSYLQQVYQADGDTTVISEKSGQQQTYRLQVRDYHSQRHGQPAPYRRTAVVNDLLDLLTQMQPRKVYWPLSCDSHPDHQATAWFVHDALQSADFQGESLQYLIHAGTVQSWPRPSDSDPNLAFSAPHDLLEHLAWPPKLRSAVSLADNEKKLAAINAYASQLQVKGERDYLHGFIKAEEVFW